MERPEWIAIGQVTAPHGVRGAVRVFSLSDVPDRLFQVERVYVANGGGHKSLEVRSARPYRSGMAVMRFAEVTTRDEAERMRGAYLLVPVDEVPPLPDGVHYVFEIVGLPVYLPDGSRIGTVQEVIPGKGAHDLYVVERGPGKRPVLVPAAREIVRVLDPRRKQVVIDPPPGLIEE